MSMGRKDAVTMGSFSQIRSPSQLSGDVYVFKGEAPPLPVGTDSLTLEIVFCIRRHTKGFSTLIFTAFLGCGCHDPTLQMRKVKLREAERPPRAQQLGDSGADSNKARALPVGLSTVLCDRVNKACQVTTEALGQQTLNNKHQMSRKGEQHPGACASCLHGEKIIPCTASVGRFRADSAAQKARRCTQRHVAGGGERGSNSGSRALLEPKSKVGLKRVLGVGAGNREDTRADRGEVETAPGSRQRGKWPPHCHLAATPAETRRCPQTSCVPMVSPPLHPSLNKKQSGRNCFLSPAKQGWGLLGMGERGGLGTPTLGGME